MAVFFYVVLIACFSISMVRSSYGLYQDIKKAKDLRRLRNALCEVLSIDLSADYEVQNEKEFCA